MSTKIIPAQTIKTCDCCQCVMDKRTSRHEGRLSIKRHLLDMQGSPYADGGISLDLCDKCLNIVCDAVNSSVAATRTAP